MAVSDYSTTPSENKSISGINIAEGCNPGGLNNAQRQMMADIRVMYNDLPELDDYVPKEGAVFDQSYPTYSGRGAFIGHNNSANVSGRIFVQSSSAAEPTLANGDILMTY